MLAQHRYTIDSLNDCEQMYKNSMFKYSIQYSSNKQQSKTTFFLRKQIKYVF